MGDNIWLMQQSQKGCFFRKKYIRKKYKLNRKIYKINFLKFIEKNVVYGIEYNRDFISSQGD